MSTNFTILIYTILILKLCLSTSATIQRLPQLCDGFKCPPLSEIQCPKDSAMRELRNPLTVFQTTNDDNDDETTTTTRRTITTKGQLGEQLLTYNGSSSNNNNGAPVHDEELFSLCCLAQKCICKTCYIPDCYQDTADADADDDDDVVIAEIVAESMDKPGQCCGEYKCMREPNCAVERDTLIWLRDCQRCQCKSGHRICHPSCDEEGNVRNTTAICNSKSLNAFFKHGERWRERCRQCECMLGGEVKCVEPICRSIDCPASRQLLIEGRCCPVCWPKGIPMPKRDDYYEHEQNGNGNGNSEDEYNDRQLLPDDDVDTDADDEVYSDEIAEDNITNNNNNNKNNNDDDEHYNDENATLPPLRAVQNHTIVQPLNSSHGVMSTTTTTPITPTPAATTAPAAAVADAKANADATVTATSGPCQMLSVTKSNYQSDIYPEVIELLTPTTTAHTDLPYYIIIILLALIIIILLATIIQLRARQRSYRPVSHFDDNCNKTMTNNMKKMNEYA